MFGWIRKLTQRTAVEELIDSSASDAPEIARANTTTQQAPMPQTEAFAQPASEQAPVQHDHAPRMVDVYTPEPMPEPPTFGLPEPHAEHPFESDSALPDTELVDWSAADAQDAVAEAEDAFESAVPEPLSKADAPFVAPVAEATREAAVVEAEVVEAKAVEVVVEAEGTADVAVEAVAVEAEANEVVAMAEPVAEAPAVEAALSPLEAEFDGLLSAPSPRPAMPLSAHPNFAGLGLAEWEPIAPRLLEPEAALTPEAQEELLKLFDDLFGPCGRYRLEWRTERRAGDDAMFAEIMTADLVRRVQNTIADVAELERPEPPKAIQAAFVDLEESEDTELDEHDDEAFRRAS